jgi:cellulose synthase/poly-beta-1,6-N-acetylglucosamine synthase-like glycosyltransferase
VIVLEVIAWTALGLILWTHAGYPALAWAWARLRPAAIAAADVEPRVALVIAAHNEADVIAARLDNALALDYPRDRLRIIVASDASDDGTDDIVRAYADRGVELVRAERGGKVNAQDTVVRALGDDVEILAFSDANCAWEPDALRRLVRPFADERVAYACGRLRLRRADGTNLEGAYWRFEVALRGWEARMGSITGGNGSIYAVRRERYLFVDPRFGHDLSFPYRMVQDGFTATYAPDAIASEKPSAGMHDEFRRKVRMFGHCWLIVFHGRMFSLRREGPRYWLQMISHRLLRYASGLLHLVLLLATLILAARDGGLVWIVLLAGQMVLLGLAALSAQTGSRWRPLALIEYYLLVTIATVIALWEAVVHGIEPVWERAEGTR